MNLARPSRKIGSCAFQFWLALLRLLPKQKCQAFSIQGAQKVPRIEKVYPLEQIREAHTRSETGRVVGKLVLKTV